MIIISRVLYVFFVQFVLKRKGSKNSKNNEIGSKEVSGSKCRHTKAKGGKGAVKKGT